MKFLSTNTLSCVMVSIHLVSCLLDNADRSDVMAVKRRLEEDKERILLLQNDLEVLMLKFAKLERRTGMSTSGLPMALAAGIEDNAARLRTLEDQLKLTQATVSPGGAATYVRWGRTDCPENGTERVYRGYMAGSWYKSEVGTSSYLCLPHDVTWGNFHDGQDAYNTHVYGTEMDLDNSATILGKNVYNQNAPCAVCRTIRSSALMIPARTGCFPGWTLEYSGYLVSNYPGGSISTEAVCLDADPELVDGHGANENESVIHFVEVRCGSLSCPPYEDGRELACVVCSK